MKCRQCGYAMKKVKLSTNKYEYECPKCGYSIKSSRKQDDSPYKDAYEIVMGKAAYSENE